MNKLFAAALLAVAAAAAWPASAQQAGTLAKIAESGQIVFGFREAAPPFSAVDPATKAPIGYSIDLCHRIADGVRARLGRPDIAVQFQPVTAENRFQKIIDGSIDLECGTSTMTLARLDSVDFTFMTFITGGALLVPQKATVKGMADLDGKTVGVVERTTTEAELRSGRVAATAKIKIETFGNYDDGLKALEKGRIAALAGDQLILIGLARNTADPSKFAIATELFSYEPYALALRRNDADFRLVANRVLANLYRSGEVQAIYDRWFGDWGGRPSSLLIAMFALNGIPEGTP